MSRTLVAFDVTVVIPTFDRLWCLPTAVESCRQRGVSTEIVVVDDGSTDGTWEWLQTQDDVVAVRQSNWGKPWAVNAGFARARGDYVRFLDSDDWLLPCANERQVAMARAENADVVVAGTDVYSESGAFVEHCSWIDCDDFIARQLGECDSSHYSAYLFRRDFVADIPHRPDFHLRDDRLFVLEVAMAHPRVSVCRDAVFAHRHHTRARLQTLEHMNAVVRNAQHLALYQKILARLESSGELTPRRRRAAAKVLWPLAHWIGYTHPADAADVANWVFALDPGFAVPETGLLGALYRCCGFQRTEVLLRARRALLATIRQPVSG